MKKLLELDKNPLKPCIDDVAGAEAPLRSILHPGAWDNCLALVHWVPAACCQLVRLTTRHPDPDPRVVGIALV